METINGIQYIIERKKGKKRLTVRVYRQGYVKVSVPFRTSRAEIDTFVGRHAKWISGTLATYQDDPDPLPPHTYATGDQFLLFNQERYLVLVPSEKGKPGQVRFEKDLLVVETASRSKASIRSLILQAYSREGLAWYTQTVGRLLVEIQKTQGAFPTPLSLSLAPYPVRLGSCSSAGHIVFALRSLLLPPRLCEYIALHELLHLVCFNHGREFKELLTLHMSDWKVRKEELGRLSKRIAAV